ncbi:MAG: CHAT domain-containing protein [Nostocaceae cyanobacterium]|nr:CHAT domain-containing protein [Nostocaceae cyanobacterium]
MFERFTEKAVKVVMLAQEETRRLGHKEVGTAELLLGLILEETGLASRVLRTVGVNLENARLEVEKIRGRGSDIRFNEHDFSDCFRRVVYELSIEEANQLKHREIAPEHLLLGLLREEEGTAIKVLQNLGAEVTQVRTQVFSMLVAQGDKNAAQFLPNTTTDSSETNRIKAYLALIQKLLSYPDSSEVEFLKNYPDLINSGLMITLEGVASILAQQGDHKGARYLQDIAVQLTKKEDEKSSTESINQVVAVPDLPPAIKLTEADNITEQQEQVEQIDNVQYPTHEATQNFLFQLLRVIFESKADSQVVYPFLEENLDKLNESFPEVLRDWATAQLSRVGEEQKPKLAKIITTLSTLIRKFELGDPATNLEIALTGYEIVDNILTKAEDSVSWAANQYCLGLTYLERSKGNPEENLKQAINYFTAALKVYDKDNFPKQRKLILNNLKNATREMRNIEELDEQKNGDKFTENRDNEVDVSDDFSAHPDNSSSEILSLSQAPERIQAYLYLIQELRTCPRGSEQTVLNDNPDLLDADLIEMMKQMAAALEKTGETQDAERLIQIAHQLSEAPSLLSSNSALFVQISDNDNSEDLVTIEIPAGEGLSENQERQQAYQSFINQLLSCPMGHQLEVFMANSKLIDAGLVQQMRQVATQMWMQGNQEAAKLLQNCAEELTTFFDSGQAQILAQAMAQMEERGIPNNPGFFTKLMTGMADAISNSQIAGNPEIFQEYWNLLNEVLQASLLEFMSGSQDLYPLLSANLDKLDETFVRILHGFGTIVPELPPESEDKQTTTMAIAVFSNLIQQFPLGNRDINLEIAITGYQICANVFTWEAFPEQWAILQQNIAVVYCQRFRGDKAENLELAITKYQDALQVLTKQAFPEQWAQIKMNLGNAYQERIRGNRTDNIERVIASSQEALQVFTRHEFPENWGIVQSNLGNAYCDRIVGNKAENLELAIAAFQDALQVHNRETSPRHWAENQNNLALAYWERTKGNRAENLERAIRYAQAALQVYTRQEFPYEWAKVQNNLSFIYCDRIEGDKAENIELAISVSAAALEVLTRQTFPKDWADAQSHLAKAYLDRIRGNRSDNLERAIVASQEALKVRTREALPQDWAKSQHNLGEAYRNRIKDDKAANLELAIATFKAALEIDTQTAFPYQWAITQQSLGLTYHERIQGDKADNQEMAIACYQAALQILTSAKFPYEWAIAQINLGATYNERIRDDRADNQERALTCYQAALQILTHEAFPEKWALLQTNLGNVYALWVNHDQSQNQELAIASYQAALEVYTQDKFPEMWARTQMNLAVAYVQRRNGNRAQNLELAIAANQAALEVLTKESFPQYWAMTQMNLAATYISRVNGDRAENLALAIAASQAALQVYRRVAFPQQWATVQVNLGNAYKYRNQMTEAIACFKLALEVFTPTTFPVDCYKAGNNIGYVAFSAGQWAEAIEGYHVAIEALEQSRYWANNDTRRQEILQEGILVYMYAVQACINNGQPDKAIEYVERGKARNLVDLLATRDLAPKGNIPQTVLNELARLRREIAAEQRNFKIARDNSIREIAINDSQFFIPSNLPTSGSGKDRTRLNELRQQLDDLINDIQRIDPTFSLTQRVEPINFHQIRSSLLLDEKNALIEWYVTNQTLYAFIITHQNESPIIVSLPEENYHNLLNFGVEYLNIYSKEKKLWNAHLDQCLQQLAEILQIDEIVSRIPANCDQLILIPHLFLHLLPIHAISLQDGNCLLERFKGGIRYAPSYQLFQLTQNQQRPNFDRIFGVQNPTLDLNYTDIEVQVIKQMFNSNDILVKQDAKKEEINNSRLRIAHCAHFSCHGYFNFEDSLRSALILADAQASNLQQLTDATRYISLREGNTFDLEKCLALGEIFSLDLNQCRLITLSACETGLTDPKSISDEYISLTSGFLYAGSPSVVASQWTVNDLSTTFLMIKFYENLHEQQKQQGYLNIAIALNQAQLWLRDATKEQLEEWTTNLLLNDAQIIQLMIFFEDIPANTKPFESPYHWAAFCAIGQ